MPAPYVYRDSQTNTDTGTHYTVAFDAPRPDLQVLANWSLIPADLDAAAIDAVAYLNANRARLAAQAALVAAATPNTTWGTGTGGTGGSGGSSIQLGVPGGAASLDGSGHIPLSELPSFVVNATFPVTSQAEMLALPAQVGDIAIRSDLSPAEWWLLGATPATTLSHWGQITVAAGAATDSSVVHITGTETIAGAKTFSTLPTVPTPPTADGHTASKKYVDDSIAPVATIAGAAAVDTQVVHKVNAETIAGVKTFSSLPVVPTTTPTLDGHVATKKYVVDTAASTAATAVTGLAVDTSVVHVAGAETIAGVKTFSSLPVIPTTTPTLDGHVATKKYVVDTAASTASSAITAAGLAPNTAVVHNTADETIAGVKTFTLSPVVPDSPPGRGGAVNRGYVDDANAVLATSVGNVDSGAAHVAGAETIAGVKTFSSLPVVPTTTPTLDGHVATKKYVVDSIAATGYVDSALVHLAGDETIFGNKAFTGTVSVPAPTLAGHAANAAYVDALDQGIYIVTDPRWGLAQGATNIAAAMNAAIAAMPSTGGTLYIPAGSWTASTPVLIKPGVHVLGAGRAASVIQFTAGGFYWSANCNSVTIEHLRLETSGGHLFYSTGAVGNGTTITPTNAFYQSQISYCYLKTNDDTSSIVYHRSWADWDAVIWQHCDVVLGSASRSVPGWDIVNYKHAANSNIWTNLRIDGANANNVNAVAIWLENQADANGYAYNNVIEGIVGERNAAGVVRALSWRGGRIAHVVDWDTTVAYTGHHVYVGKGSGAGAKQTSNVTIIDCGHRGGTNAWTTVNTSGFNDVYLAPGEVTFIDVFSANNNGVSGSIGYSQTDVVNIYNVASSTAWTGQPSGIYTSLYSLEARTGIVVGGARHRGGTGTPEHVVVGNPGDTWSRTDGNPQTSFYIKGTGTTNQGWIAVPGPWWNVMDWGAHGDGAVGQYDDTSVLNAMLAAAAPGTTIYFPQPVNHYKITGPLVVPSGVTIIGAGPACEIRQYTGYKPVFDCFNVNNVSISGFYLNNGAGPCGSTGGSTYRGDNLYAYCAGVWTNGAGISVSNCKIDKFAIGVYFAATAADGSANNDGGTLRVGNRAVDLEINKANWGILWLCQSGLRIRGIYAHDFQDSSAGVNPNHCIYGTGNTALPSYDVNVADCTTVNLAFGCAYQIKYIFGVAMSNMLADNSNGLFNGIDIVDAGFDNMTSRADTTSTGVNWSWTFQKSSGGTQPVRITMSNINISMSSDGLPMLIIADQVMMSNIMITSNHTGTFSGNNYEVSLRGKGITINGMKINNVGTSVYRAVQCGFSSSYPAGDFTINGLECTNTYDLVTWDGNNTGRNLICYDPGAQRNIGTASTYFAETASPATWGMSRTEWINTYAISGGATATPRPALETITRIAVADATAFTIAAPVTKAKTGTTHDIVIANTSSGSLGAITWTTSAGGYVLSAPVVAPAAGNSNMIRFMFDGTSWREIARSQAASTPLVIDVTAYGVIGDGIVDNSVALQALLDTAGAAQAGCELFFPPLSTTGTRAVYCFGTTLNAKSRSGVRLTSTGGQANGTSAELRYTGTGSASGITWGSSKGFGIKGMAVTYSSATYSGILVDGSLDVGHGDAVYAKFERCWFGPSGGGGNLATLVCLDGTHDIDFTQCVWWAGSIQLLGKKTQGISSTGGWAIRITLSGCNFSGSPATGAIRNADESWDINAVFEPDSAGRACAYGHDTGLRALGVVFRSCWAGDLTATTQPWIAWSGDGLTIHGGRWAGNATIVQVDGSNSHGVTLSGVAITNAPVGYAVDYGATVGCTGLVVLGTDLSIYSQPFNNPPAGYLVQMTGGVVGVSGTLQAAAVTASGTVSAPAAAITPAVTAVNLMTAAQASYETASGWSQNIKGTLSQDTANALIGTKSVKLTVTDTSGAGGSGSPSFYATIASGIAPGLTYTAFVNAKGLDSAQSYRLSIAWRDASNASLGTTYGSITAGTTTSWTQVSVTAAAPVNAASAILTVFVWTAGGTVGDRHVFDQNQFAAGTSLVWADPAGVATLNVLPAAPSSPPPNSGVTLYLDSGHLRAQRSDGSIVGLTFARRAVADAATTITTTDTVVGYTSLTAARIATLPAVAAATGQEFTIKDESGSCSATLTITVTPASGTIDGAASVVLATAYAAVTLYSDGTNWHVVNRRPDRPYTRVTTTASSATPTPSADTDDQYQVTALAANATVGAPSGTPADGQPLLLRVKDNGTARTLAWNAVFRAIGIALPSTTVASKTTYVGCRYNAADSKWDVLAVSTEA